MTLLSDDPLTQLAFSIYENKGVYALLLGSGLSRAAEIPTGWEITLDLIRRVAAAQGTPDQPDWAAWFRERAGQEPNYSALLEGLAASPEERRSILHSYIEPTAADREEGRKVPTAAHRAIASLVRDGYARVIVTTNFDRLMENALREAGVEPTVISSADALHGAEPVTHSTCYLLKLHGDYKDARILNTDEELSAYPAAYDGLLDRILDEFGLIVAGWSGEWDHALKAAIMRAPNRRYSFFWAARGTLNSGAQEIVSNRRGRVVAITDADSFFTGLAERVETLAQSHRQNPHSVALMVNRAKRYLARPEYRIQLDELFAGEAERLMTRLEAPEFAANRKWNEAEFRACVKQYESGTEALAKMAGVLGRWGDGTELPVILDLLRAMYGYAERDRSGLVVYLNLRSYPAVLAFTAYGIGLTRAQRWPVLHALLSAELTREDRDPQRLVDTLFLWCWRGGEKEMWQHIEGLERRHTPLSDYLLTLFSDWGRSFAGLSPDFEVLFERFEVLASFSYLETTPETELEAIIAERNPGVWKRMPVGRSGWNRWTRERVLAELQSESMKAALMDAGFFCGRARFMELSFANYNRAAAYIGW